jgi:hypothetical protein
VIRLQILSQVPSIYRNGSSACGTAARAMRQKTIRVLPHI